MNINININNYANNNDPLQNRAKKLVDRALTCKAIKDLYEEAKATPNAKGVIGMDWKVKFVPKSFMEFAAKCDGNRREIHLWETSSDDDAFTHFVFELTNAATEVKFDRIYKNALNGSIDSEEYARRVEKLEYEGSKKHHQVIQKAIQEKKLSPALDIYRYTIKRGFTRDWHDATRFTRHAQSYRDWFASFGKPVARMGFKEKLESSKFNATHLSTKELSKKLIAAVVMGVAAGFFAGLLIGCLTGTTVLIVALSNRILSPFLIPLIENKKLMDAWMFCLWSAIGISYAIERLNKTAFPILLAGTATFLLQDVFRY